MCEFLGARVEVDDTDPINWRKVPTKTNLECRIEHLAYQYGNTLREFYAVAGAERFYEWLQDEILRVREEVR